MWRRYLIVLLLVTVLAGIGAVLVSWCALSPLPATLVDADTVAVPWHAVAVDGTPLNRSYCDRFNRADVWPAWRIPSLLRNAFVVSEDQNYWRHGGVDWRARVAALWGNLRAGRILRGASTIGEQVARILQPRAATYWGHWLAGLQASRLLHRFGHAKVLDFYLNQVPYGARRRGVVQAARYYFAVDPDALNPAEQLALVVLVRSPAHYNPRRHAVLLRRAVNRLAARMYRLGLVDTIELGAIQRAAIRPARQKLAVDAGPFVRYAIERGHRLGLTGAVLKTTLDPEIQRFVQRLLNRRLQALAVRGAHQAAALVVDNKRGAVLAYVVAPQNGAFAIDPVQVPRQSGSSLKPFIYALAMKRLGWQPDTMIRDAPLAEKLRRGLHRYRNYSGKYYGKVSLRYALANSLNIPAVKTAQAVGVPAIVHLLHQLGFTSFNRSADFYGPAIALGDGGVRLYDLVQAYASLARHGRYLPLHVLADVPQPDPVTVLPAPVSALLANILSDPDARSAEFGTDSVLDLPMPTAVKTGTSSDYRDNWVVGFDDHYTVGLWMGRLDDGVMRGLTGAESVGPVLRQIFAHLRRTSPVGGLWHSPALRLVHSCEWIGPPACIKRLDWHQGKRVSPMEATLPTLSIARPLPGETLIIDPRLPRARQRYHFILGSAGLSIRRVVWQLDGKLLVHDGGSNPTWKITPGVHQLCARVWLGGALLGQLRQLGPVRFTVLE